MLPYPTIQASPRLHASDTSISSETPVVLRQQTWSVETAVNTACSPTPAGFPSSDAVIADQNIAHGVAHCPFLLSDIHQRTFLVFVFASLHHLNSAARADWPPHYLSDWSNEPHFCRCQIPSLCRRFFLKVVIWARSVRSLLHYFQIFSLMAYNESIGVLVYYEGMVDCLF